MGEIYAKFSCIIVCLFELQVVVVVIVCCVRAMQVCRLFGAGGDTTIYHLLGLHLTLNFFSLLRQFDSKTTPTTTNKFRFLLVSFAPNLRMDCVGESLTKF